jgi:hypothetical protein
VTDRGSAFIESLKLPDGRMFGDAMAPFQREAFAGYFAENASPNVWFSRPRGGSKTTDVAAVALADLMEAPPRSRLVAIAADKDQAGLLLDQVKGWISDNRKKLGGLEVRKDVVINPATGSRLEILASDISNLGLSPWRIYADELAAWEHDRHWSVMLTSLVKVPGSRMVVMTTAGSPSGWAYGAWEHAGESNAWTVFHTVDLAPWLDQEQLADLLGADARHLSPGAKKRYIGNVWAQADDVVFTVEEIDAITDHDLAPLARGLDGHRYTTGVDLGVTNDRTAIVTLQVGTETEPHRVARVWAYEPTRTRPTDVAMVEGVIAEHHAAFRPVRMRSDTWNMESMIQRLPYLKGETQTVASTAAQYATLIRVIRSGGLVIPGRGHEAEMLRRELIELIEKDVGSTGRIKFDHPSHGHNDLTTALAIALVQAESLANRKRRALRAYSSTTGVAVTSADGSGTLGRRVARVSSSATSRRRRRARVSIPGTPFTGHPGAGFFNDRLKTGIGS